MVWYGMEGLDRHPLEDSVWLRPKVSSALCLPQSACTTTRLLWSRKIGLVMRSHTKGIADREAWTEPSVTTNCSCLWYSLQWTLNRSRTLLVMDSIFLLFKVISCPLLSLYSSVILMYPLRNIPFFESVWFCTVSVILLFGYVRLSKSYMVYRPYGSLSLKNTVQTQL